MAIAGAVAGITVGGICFAPARWLTEAVAQWSDHRVLLEAPRGTVWRGSAQLILAGGAGSRDWMALPSRLHWNLRPGWTTMSVQLQSDCCIADPWRLDLQPRWGGAHLHVGDASTRWPAALLSGLGTPWNTLQPEGELRLSTQNLSMDWAQGRATVAGQARFVANRMSSRLSTVRPMGSYALDIQGGEAPTLALSTLDGALRLQGTGQWVGSRWRFTGEASAQSGTEDSLSNLLNIIGRREGARSIISIG